LTEARSQLTNRQASTGHNVANQNQPVKCEELEKTNFSRLRTQKNKVKNKTKILLSHYSRRSKRRVMRWRRTFSLQARRRIALDFGPCAWSQQIGWCRHTPWGRRVTRDNPSNQPTTMALEGNQRREIENQANYVGCSKKITSKCCKQKHVAFLTFVHRSAQGRKNGHNDARHHVAAHSEALASLRAHKTPVSTAQKSARKTSV